MDKCNDNCTDTEVLVKKDTVLQVRVSSELKEAMRKESLRRGLSLSELVVWMFGELGSRDVMTNVGTSVSTKEGVMTKSLDRPSDVRKVFAVPDKVKARSKQCSKVKPLHVHNQGKCGLC